MFRKRLLAFILICSFCLTGMAFSEQKDEIEVKSVLLSAEYGSKLEWETVSGSEESLALFAALCLRDMESDMDASVFRIDKILGLYAYDMVGTPTLYIHTPVYDWTAYTIINGTVSVNRSNPVADDKLAAYADFMVENGVWESPMPIDVNLMKQFLDYEPDTVASLTESGGNEALFRHAETVGPFRCGWAVFWFQDFAGYISPEGKILDGGWNWGTAFDEETGLALVYRGHLSGYGSPERNDDGLHNGVYGLIDTEGNEVVPLEYDSISYPFDDPFVLILSKEKTYLYYNLETRSFFTPEDSTIVCTAHRCSEGLIAACSGELDEKLNPAGKWGFIDTEGKTVIPCIYDRVSYLWNDGLNEVTKDGKTGVINREGETVIPFTWDSISMDNDRIIAEKDEKRYLLDRTGTILMVFATKYAYAAKNGYFVVYDTYDNGIGLLDSQGNEILPREYYNIRVLNEHLAHVARKEEDGSVVYGIVDYLTGDTVLPMVYQEIVSEADGMYAFQQLGYYGYMDTDFKTVISPQYTKAKDFNHGYAPVQKDNGEWIIIDKEGNCVY